MFYGLNLCWIYGFLVSVKLMSCIIVLDIVLCDKLC